LAGITKSVEEDLWQTVRGMEEAIMLLEQVALHYNEMEQQGEAEPFLRKARETRDHSEAIRNFIFQQERFSEDLLH
jgi:two-component system chemotaxis response regulator CheB